MKQLGGALLLASLLGASSVRACPEPEYVYGLVGHYPADGAAKVPLDSPFVLYTTTEETDRSDYLADETFVELRHPGSRLITELHPLDLVSYQEGPSAFAFVTLEPLLPDTTYEVRAGTGVYDGPDLETTSFTITTGPAARDTPLRIEGDWQVRFSPGTEPVYECERCGPCPAVGTKPATMVQLTLPRVHDGFSDVFLRAGVRVTHVKEDGSEKLMAYLPVDELGPGVTKTIEGAMALDDGEPYRACFTLEVIDGRGDRQSDRYCTDEVFDAPAEPPSEPEPEPGMAGAAGESAMPNGGDAHTASGCSASGHASGSASALAALALLGALTRRRRTRSAL